MRDRRAWAFAALAGALRPRRRRLRPARRRRAPARPTPARRTPAPTPSRRPPTAPARSSSSAASTAAGPRPTGASPPRRWAAPSARRLGPQTCDRVAFAGGRGICLRLRGTLGDATAVTVFDAHWRVRRSFRTAGLPSRTRVSPDGSLGAITTFVSGHAYGSPGTFSTATTLLDLAHGRTLGNLERFTIVRGGRTVAPRDRNLWGVTFARDEDTFYATLATGGDHLLVRGSVRARRLVVLRGDVECPSLSPDGTRIGYKKTVGSPPRWRFYVLDLRTGRDTPLAEAPARRRPARLARRRAPPLRPRRGGPAGPRRRHGPARAAPGGRRLADRLGLTAGRAGAELVGRSRRSRAGNAAAAGTENGPRGRKVTLVACRDRAHGSADPRPPPSARLDRVPSLDPMAECTHLDTIAIVDLPESIPGCEDCLKIGSPLGVPAHVHGLRPHRVLRLVAEPPRAPARRRGRAPDRALRRAGRGLELLLRRRRAFVVR